MSRQRTHGHVARRTARDGPSEDTALIQLFTDRFYGFTENRREVALDMREMVDKVKKGEPLYGKSQLTEYMQGAASRQSRYSAVWIHVMPWFNFVNHSQVRRAMMLPQMVQKCE